MWSLVPKFFPGLFFNASIISLLICVCVRICLLNLARGYFSYDNTLLMLRKIVMLDVILCGVTLITGIRNYLTHIECRRKTRSCFSFG